MKVLFAQKQYIFEDDRPFPSCHASTLVVFPNGDIAASWFGGLHEKASDVAIWVSHRTVGTWSKPVKAVDEEGIAHWNPVFFLMERKQRYITKSGMRLRIGLHG